MPEKTIAGRRIFWREFGEGRAALALHCSLAHSGIWAPVAALMPDLALTAPDLPGHGQTADCAGPDPFFTDAVSDAASFLPPSGQIDLIGHSFGGLAAIELALRRPEQIRSLTLIEPVLFAAAQGDPELERHYDEIAAFRAAIRHARDENAAREFMAIWGMGVPWDAIPPRQRSYLTGRIHLIGDGFGPPAGPMAAMVAPGRLEELAMPVRLIRGDRSPRIVAAILAGISARVPQAVTTVLTGAGHMMPVTHPGPLAKAIREGLPD